MKRSKKAINCANILLLLSLGLMGLSDNTYAQSVAAGCKTRAPSSDVIVCLADRPCFLWLRQSGRKLQVGWDGQGDYDTYNFHWSWAGKARFQGGLQGGRGGSYEIINLHSCSTYSLKVQGCKNLAQGRVHCTAWAKALFTVDPDLVFRLTKLLSHAFYLTIA